jgi:tetratricopeptide (TPR) repeat protein
MWGWVPSATGGAIRRSTVVLTRCLECDGKTIAVFSSRYPKLIFLVHSAMSMSSPELATLLRQTNISSHEDFLKAANAALKRSKLDLTAQHTRVVALLKLDRFDDALRAFEESGDKLKKEARLEFAYALYKAGELEKADEIAGEAEKGDRGLLHIAAQTVRRMWYVVEQTADGHSIADIQAREIRQGGTNLRGHSSISRF